MIHKITLPFGSFVYACDICGCTSRLGEMKTCATTPIRPHREIKVGDVLYIYENQDGNRFEGIPKNPEAVGVEDLFYSRPGQTVGVINRPTQLHTLCLSLAQNHEGKPWTPKDTSMSFDHYSYDDLLLKEEGSVEKLLASGLIRKPKPSLIKKFSIMDRLFPVR